jgi:DNA-binding LytR/AlgR family response regulator
LSKILRIVPLIIQMETPVRILILEDDLILASNMEEALNALGYHVVGIASDAERFSEMFFKESPDLIIVDIELEGSHKNGIELMSEISNENRKPFIYVSAYDKEVYLKHAKLTRPDAFLIKPVNEKQLGIAIDFALHNHYERNKIENKPAEYGSLITTPNSYYIKDKDRYVKVGLKDIIYLKADGSYTYLKTISRLYSVSANLQNVLGQMGGTNLTRCHRSYAVNIDYISGLRDTFLELSIGENIETMPVSNTYRVDVLKKLNKIKAD